MSDLITLQRHTDVSVITLSNGENRWTTSLVRDLGDALDDVESNDGPHALVTASSDPKFFSKSNDQTKSLHSFKYVKISD